MLKIQDIDIYKLDRQEITKLKLQLLNGINVPKLDEEIKNTILKLSNVGHHTTITDIAYIGLNEQERLEMIHLLLSSIEQLKIQTKNIKRNINNYNTDYEYIFNYVETTQKLLKTMYRYAKMKDNNDVVGQ